MTLSCTAIITLNTSNKTNDKNTKNNLCSEWRDSEPQPRSWHVWRHGSHRAQWLLAAAPLTTRHQSWADRDTTHRPRTSSSRGRHGDASYFGHRSKETERRHALKISVIISRQSQTGSHSNKSCQVYCFNISIKLLYCTTQNYTTEFTMVKPFNTPKLCRALQTPNFITPGTVCQGHCVNPRHSQPSKDNWRLKTFLFSD